MRLTGSWKSQICEKCASYFIIMIVNKFCCLEKCFFVHEYCRAVLLRRGIGDKRIQRSGSWVSLFHGRIARVDGALESREKIVLSWYMHGIFGKNTVGWRCGARNFVHCEAADLDAARISQPPIPIFALFAHTRPLIWEQYYWYQVKTIKIKRDLLV